MANSDPASATLRYFGSQLRLLRTRAGMSREQLAEAVGYSVEMIKSVECGRRVPPRALIDAADHVLEAGGLLKVGADHIVREKFPNWFQEYALYEAQAVTLYMYENHVVPGLVQTEDYARAVFRSTCPPLDDDEIEERVAARMERQGLLTRKPPAVLSVIIEEVILQRWIGGPAVMKGQIERLLACASMRNLELQVMPTKREAHVGLAGPMYLLETDDQQRLAYISGQRGSLLFSDPREVSLLNQRYGILRTQALTPDDSTSLMERLLGEL
ncbi:helix-turn-helix domain-containing protein [Streptomyces sp. URMC 123]|uniref:helix-turn-helix domain-containing protein n=1 Tax=Streptomyces sp. URMC 123 TaxID=3423403 RepID=UPI003F1D7EDF